MEYKKQIQHIFTTTKKPSKDTLNALVGSQVEIEVPCETGDQDKVRQVACIVGGAQVIVGDDGVPVTGLTFIETPDLDEEMYPFCHLTWVGIKELLA